jgi:hypothetical protein
MAASSINIKPVKPNSETHNERKKEYEHVNQELTPTNFSWSEKSIVKTKNELTAIVKEKKNRKIQSRATPIREGVFLFTEENTNEQILEVVKNVEKEFGIRAFQLHIHRDEGHKSRKSEDELWKPNLHAHVLFEWIDRNTGESFKLGKEDMSRLQTYFADGLGMERGVFSDKKHLTSLEFKIGVLEAEIKDLTSDVKCANQDVKNSQIKYNTMISARDEERERYLELVKENKRMEAVIFNQKEFHFDKVIYPADKRELNAYRELKIKYPEIKKIGESKEMEMKNDVKKGRGFSR